MPVVELSGNDHLLPCPFCGSQAEMFFQLDDLGDWRVMCRWCGASSCPEGFRYDKKQAINDWNTRVVNGNKVTFTWEPPNVIAPVGVWVVLHEGYMYGPCKKWQDVEKIVREEFKHDRHMVG